MEKLEQDTSKLQALTLYGTDLTKLAKEGKLDPVIGRTHEIERVTQILCKRRKNNICLTGDPGVGKTVIVEGLAQGIANASIPLKLHGNKVFSIDMGRLIAGASNREEFEDRLIKVVDEVKNSNGGVLLFIDELHTLVGAVAGGQPLDASNILKPALARGELRCIGATTVEEYRKYIEKDGALNRRFQVVDVPEPSVEDTILILKGVTRKYEVHHNVRYGERAITSAAHLSKKYISDKFLPNKAIDLIDEAGSRVHLVHSKSGLPNKDSLMVTEMDIQTVLSSWTGIPIEKISNDEALKLLHMETTLQKRLIGQDEAVKVVSRAIRRARVGIRDPNRPMASFLFTGPTGVGKTELAKLLATEYFGSKETMVRIDMSEYMEKHEASKLFGSPPGYIGHDDGGNLTEAVRRRPHIVILFDEIEKAHHDVLNTMLQILDDGRLTDGKGRVVDFTNTIVIMTCNLGWNSDGNKKKVADELKKYFKPEFLNRLDEIVMFDSLEKDQLRVILSVMMEQFIGRVREKKINVVEIAEEVYDKVLEEGYSVNYGARPLRRAITRILEDALCEEILKGNVKEGDSLRVGVSRRNKLNLNLSNYLMRGRIEGVYCLKA